MSRNCFNFEKSDVLQFYSVARYNRDGTALDQSRRQGRRPIRLQEKVCIALVGLYFYRRHVHFLYVNIRLEGLEMARNPENSAASPLDPSGGLTAPTCYSPQLVLLAALAFVTVRHSLYKATSTSTRKSLPPFNRNIFYIPGRFSSLEESLTQIDFCQ